MSVTELARDLRVERYELKYLVPDRLIPAIRAVATTTCVLDRHAGPDRTYSIRSLYFDTSDFALFRANDRQARTRFKARVRGYPGTNAPYFLEVKNRIGDVIVKTRAAVAPDRWRRVLDLEGRAIAELAPASYDGAMAFARRYHLHHLAPVLLVEYEREAYVSEIDTYGRLTFDRRIRAQPQLSHDLAADPRRWREIDHPVRTETCEPVSVLELKFEGRAPPWMSALVQRLSLVRGAFSKYCYGLSEEHTPPTARTAVLR